MVCAINWDSVITLSIIVELYIRKCHCLLCLCNYVGGLTTSTLNGVNGEWTGSDDVNNVYKNFGGGRFWESTPVPALFPWERMALRFPWFKRFLVFRKALNGSHGEATESDDLAARRDPQDKHYMPRSYGIKHHGSNGRNGPDHRRREAGGNHGKGNVVVNPVHARAGVAHAGGVVIRAAGGGMRGGVLPRPPGVVGAPERADIEGGREDAVDRGADPEDVDPGPRETLRMLHFSLDEVRPDRFKWMRLAFLCASAVCAVLYLLLLTGFDVAEVSTHRLVYMTTVLFLSVSCGCFYLVLRFYRRRSKVVHTDAEGRGVLDATVFETSSDFIDFRFSASGGAECSKEPLDHKKIAIMNELNYKSFNKVDVDKRLYIALSKECVSVNQHTLSALTNSAMHSEESKTLSADEVNVCVLCVAQERQYLSHVSSKRFASTTAGIRILDPRLIV